MISNLFAQQWINNYDFSSVYPGYYVIQMQFLNADIGFTRIKSGNAIKILKTVNRGSTWYEVNSYNIYSYEQFVNTYMYFINELTGFRSHIPTDKDKNILDKTTDGGITWVRKINTTNIVALQPLISYSAAHGFYLMLDGKYPDYNLKIYRSIDGFESYEVVYDQYPWLLNDKFRFFNSKSFEDGQIAAVGFVQRGNNTDYFRLITNNEPPYRPYISHGTTFVDNYLKLEYITKTNNNYNYLGTQEYTSGGLSGTRFYFDFDQNNSTLINSQYSYSRVGGLSLSTNSKGFALIDDKVYWTLNSGQNWSQDGILTSSVTSGQDMLTSFSDVCYAVTSPGKFHTRKIPGYFNTNFDWQAGNNGSIAVDGENVGTPSTGYFRGGSTTLYANKYLVNPSNNTEACFYYWGGNCSGSMSNNSNSYLINSGSYINADYKTKFISQDINSIRGATQTKVIKDTIVNGVSAIHQINQSMGGIFYTKSTDNGANFKPEEVVNYNINRNDYWGNKNAFMNIIRIQDKPVTVYDSERNVAVVWERYNPSNGKDEIKVAKRYLNINNQEPYWSTYDDYGGGVFTSFPSNSDFEAKPKIFVREVGSLNNDYCYLYLVPHLRPDGNQTKLIVTLRYKDQNIDYLIDNGNISDLAVTSPFNFTTGMFPIHFVYKKDNRIRYKYAEIGTYVWGLGEATPYYQPYPSLDYEISNNTSMLARNTPDITLKNISNNPNASNMQPVVSYQAQYTTKIIIENEDGPIRNVSSNYYPIVVRERILNTNGGVQWSPQNIQYNSNATQQNPGLEGSKNKNSYVLSYSMNNNVYMIKIPNWEGDGTYYSTRNNMLVNDARLVEGSMYNSIATQQIYTLEPYSSIFKINQYDYSITNGTNIENPFDGVCGTLIEDNIQYSFNLGSILVNNDPVNFNIKLDTVIDNSVGLNDFMTSNSFTLNENDTLIIGRNAHYVANDESGNFLGIEYWVNLVNENTGEIHRVLAHDTLKTGDSTVIEYLEGYIIRDIDEGQGSFYVQLVVDSINADGYGGSIINGFSGSEETGDNHNIKRKIFWEDAKITSSNNNLPTSFNLYQNFPNPFNPATIIKYDLPKDVKVTIKIYDLLGREVVTLINDEYKNAGRYELAWNAANYATGVYIYRIEAGDYVSTKKMVLVK
jgi:hypothetical protein